VIGEATRNRALRVALLTYRGNPFSGGQGVYVRELSRALTRLGHQVTVFAGPPYPDLDHEIALVRLPSLDLYRPESPFRPQREIRDWIDLLEFGVMSAARYPEPLAFSLRARRELSRRRRQFDVVHDNQCLGYGLLGLDRRLPVVATIHHAIGIDLQLELAGEPDRRRRKRLRRWYGFVGMQRRVARRLRRLITVSDAARDGIVAGMRVNPHRVAVVPNGVDTELFRPLPGVRRVKGRVVATVSSDAHLKGLGPLLAAIATLRRRGHRLQLVIVGRPRRDGPVPRLIRQLGLDDDIRFVGGVDGAELVRLYAEATLAVVPSIYEGFSLPAAEAMASGVPLVATAAGGLPEVVGAGGESALLVPPGDALALADAIEALLDDGGLASRLAASARCRALDCFSWTRTAMLTATEYERVLCAC
jgi:glycosyltransferase involved in cell wall biosynthesis